MLSKKLGKKVWFFGDFYSEFDAIVYAYLSVLYSISLPNNPLQYHIKSCQNLVNFINRISKDVFKQETFNSVKTAKGVANDPMLTPTERDFLESEKKTKIIAAAVAVLAMGAFAAWKGFYQSVSHTLCFNEINLNLCLNRLCKQIIITIIMIMEMTTMTPMVNE